MILMMKNMPCKILITWSMSSTKHHCSASPVALMQHPSCLISNAQLPDGIVSGCECIFPFPWHTSCISSVHVLDERSSESKNSFCLGRYLRKISVYPHLNKYACHAFVDQSHHHFLDYLIKICTTLKYTKNTVKSWNILVCSSWIIN